MPFEWIQLSFENLSWSGMCGLSSGFATCYPLTVCKSQYRELCSTFFFFFFNLFIYLFIFIFGCVGSSFLCKGFLQLWQVGATLHCGARASHHRSLSCCGAQAPDAQAQ